MGQIIIDVREPYEYNSGHVAGAINIPVSKIASDKQLRETPLNTRIIVYCRSGNRSAVAQAILGNKGYTHVVNGIDQQQIEAV